MSTVPPTEPGPRLTPHDVGGAVCDAAPVSFVQQRLWLFEQLEPGSLVFQRPSRLRLRGSLRPDLLERTLEEVVRRHESLRTVFSAGDAVPLQIVQPLEHPRLAIHDLSGLSASERETRLEELEDDASRPFDLSRGPLFRARLVRLGLKEHLLLWNVHHIVFDAWSMGVLRRELEVLYAAFAAGAPSPLPDPLKYSDYARRQRDTLGEGRLDESLEFWKTALAGAPDLLDLPFDRPRPSRQRYRGAVEDFTIGSGATEALKTLARENGATLFMAVLAAFQVFLARYTGRSDFLVGVPIAGRQKTDTESVIGCFINTLVIRADLSGSPGFRELLGRVRTASLRAFAHQDAPIEKVVEALQPRRGLDHAPLFQVMLNYRNVPGPRTSDGPVAVDAEELPPRVAMVDLTLELSLAGGELAARFTYDRDLFDPPTIRRMAEHLGVLIESGVADPDKPVAELPLWTPSERRRVLVEWNGTLRPFPADLLVHELFDAEAARRPDRPAIVGDGDGVTYGDLARRASRLAARLVVEGIRPETPVGLCLETSVEMLVAILAVWKAGGAWVPLDPGWPSARLDFVARDARCALVLTDAEAPAGLAEIGVRTLRVGGEQDASADDGSPPVFPSGDGSRLAYILYTSGSSGQPKGVAVEHHSVLNYLQWVNEALFGGASVRLPVVSGLGFDASLKQLLAPLVRGDAVWLLPREVAARPHALAAALEAAGTAALNCVPALWSALLEELEGSQGALSFSGLTALYLGGERVPPQLVRRTLRRLPHLEIWNLYGPTEATANATAGRLPADGTISIGRPIANARIYVLDPHGQPAPVGVPGEIYVGGAGVARGYWNRDELTRERFLRDPFCGEPDARMYRTGDLARYRADGSLEYLGRCDDQVKIRGLRVEPGEIEGILASHPDIAEAAVIAGEDAHGDVRLAAYVVDRTGRLSLSELRAFLRGAVPEAMVPSALVVLSSLPRLPGGKVDRSSLPDPAAADLDPASSERPRSEEERALAELWAGLLQIDRIGRDESFFDRGGHSLLAARAVWGIREIFGVEIPLRTMFESPTVGALAERIRALRPGQSPEGWTPVRPRDRDRPIPLSYAQERLWFLAQLEPHNPFYNLTKSLRVEGPLDSIALARSLGVIVERHEALRTRFPSEDGTPVQEIVPPASSLLEIEDLSGLAGPQREAEALRISRDEARRPFDLTRELPFRARLLRLDPENHILILSFHHIAVDAWSLEIFFRELGLAYDAFRRGESPSLEALPVQYADFAAWQRGWLSGPVLETRLAFWREQLRGAPELLELTGDHPRPPRQSYRGARETFAVGPAITRGVRDIGRSERATLYMTLLAAFQVLLSRYTGSTDVVVGSPIANRPFRETEKLIGLFINTLVLRTDFSGDLSFRELLRRVRETSLGAYAHQDIPFERLIEELQPARTLRHSPVFQVLFALQSAPRAAPGLPGLTVTMLPADSDHTKFDLTLSMSEDGEGLHGVFSYNSDLFEPETIRRMVSHFQTLLRGVGDDPDLPVSGLPLLTEAERNRILSVWNRTRGPLPARATVGDLVARQMARRPGAVAIEADGEQSTYAELEERVERLAGRLRQAGLGPERVAALFGRRSIDLIVGLLAIIESGGAYLPLDPSLPPRRLDVLLQDAQPHLVVARMALPEPFRERGLPVVAIDHEPGGPRKAGTPDRGTGDPDRLAYVIYTSGSTGRPKGVEVSHRSLLNFTLWAREAFRLKPEDRVLQFAPLHFDTAIEEIFPTLAAGATLVLRPDAAIETPAAFLKWCRMARLTVLDLPTAYWHEIVAALAQGEAELPETLRLVVIGGEAALPQRVEQWRRTAGTRVRLLNTYGPTEATVAATMADLTDPDESGKAVAIGRPIRNVRAYVLDGRQTPVPIGVPGELYLAGAGIARGYRNKSAASGDGFSPDPFAEASGALGYRTGDRARFRPDGALEFLGRLDDQVKIRGFRVEPAEVERCLMQHPQVTESAVVAAEDAPGDRRLIAYWAGPAGTDLAARPLREFLAERLPDYMIPAAFVRLERLPRGSTGKVDRRALPAHVPPEGPQAPAEALSGTEELLLTAWRTVLGFDRIGIHDDFFELGGHSLMATRVLSRVRQTLRIEVPLRLLFEHPTIAGLSAAIEEFRPDSPGGLEP